MKVKNRLIVEYIAREWANKAASQNNFATVHGIDEKTVRQIKYDKDYQISLVTIMKICEARELKLSEFFKLVGL